MKFFLAVFCIAAVHAEAEANAEADPALLYGAYGYDGLGAYGYGLGLNDLGYSGLHGLGYAGYPYALPTATVVAEEKAVDDEAVAKVKTVAAPLAVAPYNLGAYGYGLGAYGYGLGAVHGLAAPASYAGAHYYGKRSADAEADPALLYGAYGYSPYS